MPSLTMSMPGRHLRDAVLDLHAGVHLQEEVLRAASVEHVEQALDGAGAAVVHRARGLDGDRADPLAQRLVDDPLRRRRLLDELLVAALDRAVALAEVDRVAVPVGEHLDLDVARVGQVALEVDRRVGEELLALARGALEGGLQLLGAQRHAEALAAAAARRLDRDRVADLVVGDPLGVRQRRRPPRPCPGTIGTPASRMSSRARVLEPIASIALGRRADEDDARRLAGPREGGVLGEEAVAGVDRLGARRGSPHRGSARR